jgi:plasmid stabilization system protein ParE
VTRPLFSIVVLTRAQKEIDSAALWWSENRENPDAVRDEFRRFCENVAVFPEIGTLVVSSRVAARRILLPDIEYHVYYRVRPRAHRVEVLSFWYAGRGARPGV